MSSVRPAPQTSNTTSRLFCYFTGVTRGRFTVIECKENDDTFTLALRVNNSDLRNSHYVQINGILFAVTARTATCMTVSTTKELGTNTNINKIDVGDTVSVGILAQLDDEAYQQFLIHPSANSTATVTACAIAPGHEHTLKIDFEYRGSAPILQDQHIGLDGSSLFARNVYRSIDGLQTFSIYAGRQTRESTRFNNTLRIGESVNVTEPVHFRNPL